MKKTEDNLNPDEANGTAPELTGELLEAGQLIKNLSRETPPKGLAQRTLDRSAEILQRPSLVKRSSATLEAITLTARQKLDQIRWWLKPVTHPIARGAAAALLVGCLGIFAHLDTAERVGKMTSKVIGEKNTDRLCNMVDRVLVTLGPVKIKENDLDRLIGGHGAAKPINEKARGHKKHSTSLAPRLIST